MMNWPVNRRMHFFTWHVKQFSNEPRPSCRLWKLPSSTDWDQSALHLKCTDLTKDREDGECNRWERQKTTKSYWTKCIKKVAWLSNLHTNYCGLVSLNPALLNERVSCASFCCSDSVTVAFWDNCWLAFSGHISTLPFRHESIQFFVLLKSLKCRWVFLPMSLTWFMSLALLFLCFGGD